MIARAQLRLGYVPKCSQRTSASAEAGCHLFSAKGRCSLPPLFQIEPVAHWPKGNRRLGPLRHRRQLTSMHARVAPGWSAVVVGILRRSPLLSPHTPLAQDRESEGSRSLDFHSQSQAGSTPLKSTAQVFRTCTSMMAERCSEPWGPLTLLGPFGGGADACWRPERLDTMDSNPPWLMSSPR